MPISTSIWRGQGAEEFEVDKGRTVEALLGDGSIEIAINPPVPKVRARLNLQTPDVGKLPRTDTPWAIRLSASSVEMPSRPANSSTMPAVLSVRVRPGWTTVTLIP